MTGAPAPDRRLANPYDHRYPDAMSAPQSMHVEGPLGRYHIIRSGEGPARLLMLHANGFNGGTYLPLLHRLAPDGGWAAPDFRGHGGSFTPRNVRSWFEFADDVAAWEQAALFQRPLVLGHSLGGVTALLTEATRPGTFRGIVLLDPVVFRPRFLPIIALAHIPPVRERNPMVRGAMSRRMEFPDRPTLVENYAEKRAFATWDREFLEAYIQWGTREVEGGVRLSCEKETEARIFSTWPLRFWQYLRRVQCPVLILRGAESSTLIPPTAALMKKKLPNATWLDIPGAGHFLPMEQPDAVTDAVREWHSRHFSESLTSEVE